MTASQRRIEPADAREVRIGLLGYGCVGAAVDRLLTEQSDEIERTLGVRPHVARALVRDVRKPRSYPPRAGLLTTDFAEIADDSSIDLAVEVMGGLFPAERYIRELLAAGKPVVSANKQLLAARGRELSLAAETVGLPLRFEAAVCGAVPIVRTICEALPPGSVHRIRGIVNGTTNFVLTRMEDGASLLDALGEARHAGYAEADATDDLSGADAAAKMALLACVAFGEPVTLADVEWRGIADVSSRTLATARAAGRRLRLVGEACRENGALRVRVAPTELLDTDPLAKVPAAFNQIELEGSGFQQLTLRGPGAGGPETATAVIGDILAIANAAAGVTRSRLLPLTDTSGLAAAAS